MSLISVSSRGNRSYLQQQIQEVVHALKRLGKWNTSLSKFQILIERLYTTAVESIERSALLEPFLHVLASKKSGWSLTQIVLTSISNLIDHNILSFDDPTSVEVLNNIVEIVLQSKYADTTNQDPEEVPQISILRLFLSCVGNPLGIYIKPNLILDIVTRSFNIVIQTKKTELFQEVSEKLVKEIILRICKPTLENHIANHSHDSSQQDATKQVLLVHAVLKNVITLLYSSLSKNTTLQWTTQQCEEIQQLSLQIFNDFISEFMFKIEKFPRIVLKLICDELTRNLLETLKTNNLRVFSLSARIYFNLFVSLKSHLKLQFEVFFKTLILQILENKTRKPEIQEVALELLVEFCSEPQFISDLYVNYDCDLYCSNVWEILCKYLYKNAFPVSGSLVSRHLAALNGLQLIIQTIYQSMSLSRDDISSSPLSPNISPSSTKVPSHLLTMKITKETSSKVLREVKQVKQLLMAGIDKFNNDPKIENSLKFLQDNGLVPVPLEAKSVAEFFRNTPGLSKANIGKYFGEKEEFNISALRYFITAFVSEYESEDQSPLLATVRAFLESFRLPGEAQKVDRIFENFAQIYYEHHIYHNKAASSDFPFDSSDGIFVMCFSIAMLNTDQHSPSVRNKMTLEQYIKLARDTKYTKDLTTEFIENIYYGVKNNEIKLPDENPNDAITANTWQSLLRRAKYATFIDTLECKDIIASCNRDMFTVIWGPVIAAISVVFDNTFEDTIVQRSLEVFRNCAVISANFNLNEVFDNLVISISKFSGLPLLYPTTEYSTSSQLINFAANKKGHLACYILFEIIRLYGTHLREAWKNVLECLIAVYRAELITINTLVEVPDFLKGDTADPTPQKKEESKYLLNPLGYFLDYSSWFGSSAPEKPDPQEKTEAENVAREVIVNCKLKMLVDNTKNIHMDSLTYLVKGIILASNKSSHFKLPLEKSDIPFFLDLITGISLLNSDRIAPLWPLICEYFVTLFSNSTGNLLKKTIANFLLLCNSLISNQLIDEISRSLELLHRIHDSARTEQINEKISLGIAKILEGNIMHIKGRPNWYIWISFMEYNPATMPIIPYTKFKMLTSIITPSMGSNTSYVCKENFALCLTHIIPYIKSPDTELSLKGIQLLFQLFCRIKDVFGLNATSKRTSFDGSDFTLVDEVWKDYWHPALSHLFILSRDSRSHIRESALIELHRASLHSSLFSMYPVHWMVYFEKLLFPLLSDFVSPSDTSGYSVEQVEAMRSHGVQLLSKVFLQHLSTITSLPWSDFKALWMKILHVVSLYMNESKENSRDAIKESLKNIMLVMSAAGIFQRNNSGVSPGQAGTDAESINEQDIWNISWTWINTFCPTLQEDIASLSQAPSVDQTAVVVNKT